MVLNQWEKPTRQMDPVILKSHEAVSQVLANSQDFHVPWGESISYLVSSAGKTFGKDFCLAGDGPANHQSRIHVERCLYQPTQWEAEIRRFFELTTTNLLKKAGVALPPSPGLPGEEFEVDIIRDVIVPLNTRFVAEFFGLPIKTAETAPHGIYTEHELYGILTGMFSAVFFDSDPANSFKLRTRSRELALGLEQLVRLEAGAARTGWVANVAARLGIKTAGANNHSKNSKVGGVIGTKGGKGAEKKEEWPSLPDYGRQLLLRMMEKGKTVEECVAGTVMPIR